ncbi:hypothetical protein AU467_25780 [Mesorhizobium loti]|uniref:Uncharacterized protein n=1 Tax=Rhizobium loti TaxID=381 RepID=A0A101KR90_RHILI|nr:hypothetical protein AU467_25780 [Mesorhizobium loti]
MLDPCLPDRFRTMARKQHEQMELPADRVLQGRELGEPSSQVRQPERGVAPMFRIPVYGGYRVIRGQRASGPAGMVVDGAQRSHATIGDVGAVFLG